ncbi:MAG: YfiR family protein [bacterium]
MQRLTRQPVVTTALPIAARGIVCANGMFMGLMLLLILLSGAANSGQYGETESEQQRKARYVFNFIRFIEWPTAFELASGQPLNLCVLGKTTVIEALQSLEGKSLRGHVVRVSRHERHYQMKSCHLVFVSDIDRHPPRQLIDNFSGQPVLLVSDAPGFARQGGMLGLVKRGDKVMLEVNQRAIESANLEVSSMLLEVAILVRGR